VIQKKLQILKEIFGDYRKEGDEQYLFFCPNPDCNHHKKKLSININKNLFKCWICSCKGSNIKFLIKKYGSYQQLEEWNKLNNEVDVFQRKELKENENLIVRISLPKEYIFLLNENSYSSKRALNYLFNRGIGEKDILKWKIGFAPTGSYAGRVIIPSFDKFGYVNYFIARTFEENYIKYLNPKLEHNLIFNELIIDWNDDIILVEGVFDAIKFNNAIPLLTSTLNENSKLFETIVERKERVFIALDSDAKKKELKIIDQFMKYGIDVYKIDINPFKDPSQMTRQQFEKRKNKSIKIDRLNLLRYKMDGR
jgi:DNA primase